MQTVVACVCCVIVVWVAAVSCRAQRLEDDRERLMNEIRFEPLVPLGLERRRTHSHRIRPPHWHDVDVGDEKDERVAT